MAKVDIGTMIRNFASAPRSEDTKDFLKHEIGISLSVAFIFAFIEAVEFWEATGSLSDNLVITLLTAAIAFLLTSNLVFVTYRRKKELESIVAYLDERTRRMVQYFALGTPRGNFDATIRSLTEPSMGKVTWLVAKFLAEKLDRVFREDNSLVIFNMDLQQLSDFQSDIVRECESSIYLTCPFPPGKWFDTLIEENRRKSHKSGKKLNRKEIQTYFRHLVAFKMAELTDKKRVVVLDQGEWSEMLQSKTDFEEFCKVSRGNRISLRFVKNESLSFNHEYNLAKEDYGIYDRKVVLHWKPDSSHPKRGTLRMAFDVDQYLEIFEHTDSNPFMRDSEVKKLFES